MSTTYRKPTPGRYGTQPVYPDADIPAITANTTTTQTLNTPNVKAYVSALSALTFVVPADADGAITVIVYKWNKIAGAAVALTAAFNLETLVAKNNTAIPILTSLTDLQRTLLPGDILYATITNDSAAIDTQPTGLKIAAELFILT